MPSRCGKASAVGSIDDQRRGSKDGWVMTVTRTAEDSVSDSVTYAGVSRQAY